MISKKAKMLESSFRSIKLRKIISKMMLNPKRENKHMEPPKRFYKKYDVNKFLIDGRTCITTKGSLDSKKHILYFHGGAYTLQTGIVHWQAIDFLLQKIGCSITLIDYPLAPEHNCIDCIQMVKKAYIHLFSAKEQDVVLMGDSAGGGLALSLAMCLKEENIKTNLKKIVLLSPWLDVSMADEIPMDLKESDLILDAETLKAVGSKYKDNLDPKDYRCSPLYGDINSIGDIAIFTGTKDILYVQAKKLKERLEDSGCSLSYYEYEDMQHTFMTFPIPEASDAMEKVVEFINR